MSTDHDFTDVDDTTAEMRRRLKPVSVGAFLHEVMGWSHESLSAIERRRWSDLERPFWVEQDRELSANPLPSCHGSPMGEAGRWSLQRPTFAVNGES